MAEIIRLYEQGLTVSQIAKKLNVKALYVYTVIRKHLKGKEDELK